MKADLCIVCVVLLTWLSIPIAAHGAKRENLATNASFEVASQLAWDPAPGWWCFTSCKPNFTLETETRRAERRSLKLSAQKVMNAHLGLFQEMAVDSSKQYEFQVYVRNNPTDPLADTAHGMVGIEWMNDKDKEIYRVTSPKWDRSLSRMRWERFSVRANAPPAAVKVRFVIYLFEGQNASRGSCLIDDVEIAVR